jgi:hypothetical protein
MLKSPTAAEPPGGGRQDHETMRLAALRPVRGPASTNTLAAGGGLELPGLEAHVPHADPAGSGLEPIPGERDATTLTHREPGAIGGSFTGADIPSPDRSNWMDPVTSHQHEIEGGGT